MNYLRKRQKARKMPGTAILAPGTRVTIGGSEYALTHATHIEAAEITVVPVADLYQFWNMPLWKRVRFVLTGDWR